MDDTALIAKSWELAGELLGSLLRRPGTQGMRPHVVEATRGLSLAMLSSLPMPRRTWLERAAKSLAEASYWLAVDARLGFIDAGDAGEVAAELASILRQITAACRRCARVA